jgi:DNA-binding transcriptional ArsR family regulator
MQLALSVGDRWPRMRELYLSYHTDADTVGLARAFEAGLCASGRLRTLTFAVSEDVDMEAEEAREGAEGQLVGALAGNAERARALWRLELEARAPLRRVVQAMEGGAFGGLRELVIFAPDLVRSHVGAFAKMLSGGALPQLRDMYMDRRSDCRGVGWASILRALLQGACPRLEVLWFSQDRGNEQQVMRSLAGLLGGEAPCSSSLRTLRVEHEVAFANRDLGLLAEALRRPGAARLESMTLHNLRDAGISGLQGLVDALKGEAGSRLRELVLGDCGMTHLRGPLTEAMEEGALPRLMDVQTPLTFMLAQATVSQALTKRFEDQLAMRTFRWTI